MTGTGSDEERLEAESDSGVRWRDIRPRHLVTILILLAGATILYLSRGRLGPYLLGFTLAYMVLPVVRWVESWLPTGGRWGGARRPLATVISLLLIVVAAVAFVALMARSLTDDLDQIAQDFPGYWTEITQEGRFGEWYTEYVPEQARNWIDPNLGDLGRALTTAASDVLATVAQTTGTVIGAVVALIIVPVFMIYVLIDRRHTEANIRRLMPERWVDDTLAFARITDGILAAYTRGVIISSFVVGAITGAGYWIIGVDLWLALAVIAFFGEIVPILGPWIAFIITLPVILVTQPDKALWAVLVFGIIQALEGWFVSPKIQSASIEFPPTLVLLALAIGSEVAGAIGVVLAIPVAAILRALAIYVLRRTDGARPAQAADGLIPSEGLRIDWRRLWPLRTAR